MAKPGSGSCSDSNIASQNVVFIDTSLDTHLALFVSDSDTVSDLKKKILYEHPLCFPNTGKIQIHALKVKRKGYFYHLSDSMFVKSAFDGIKKNWFLCVDASHSMEHGENQQSHIPGSNNILACFGTNNSTSFDRIDLPHDGSLIRPSNINGSPLVPVGSNQNVKENVCIGDRYGSSDFGVKALKEKNVSVHGFGKDASQQDIAVPEYSLDNAGREVSFDMRMGNKSIPDEPCRSSSSNISKRSVSTIERKNYLSKETEVTEKHGGMIEKFKNDVDVQGNKSLEEASQSRSHKKRKRNIEKKIGDDDSLKEKRVLTCDSTKEISKANTILGSISSEPVEDSHLLETGSSSGKHKKRRKKTSKTLNQVVSAVPSSGKDVREENSQVTVGPNHKDSGGEPGAASVPGQDVQLATVTASELSGISLKEKQGDSVHEMGENNELPSSLVDKQKTNVTVDSLATEPLENVHFLETDSSRVKKKRKKKSDSLNQVVTAVPSAKDTKEENSRVTVEINQKDSTSVTGECVQGAMTSGLCEISEKEKEKEKQYDFAVGQHDKVPSSRDLDMCDTDAGNVKSKSDATEGAAAVGVGRNIKDSCVIDFEGHPSVIKELNNLPILSRPENSILNDNANCETDQTDRVEEKRESSHDGDPKGMLSGKDKPSSRGETDMNAKEVIVTSKLSDGTGIVEHSISGKKKRKKRKAEDSVGGTPIKLGTELVKGSEHEISSAEPDKAVNSDNSTNNTKKEERNFSQSQEKEVSKVKTLSTSLLASGGETGDVNGDDVESSKQISNTQADAEKDEKMSKKSKRKQNATAKNLLDLQTKDQDVVHKDPKPSTDDQKEVQASGGETGDVNGDEVEHLKKISKTQANAENVDEKMSKKSKKKKKATPKILLDLKTKDQDAGDKDPTPSADNQMEVQASGGETGDVNGDDMDSSKQISKTQAIAENMDRKMSKKSKKKQSATAENLLDLQTKDQDVGHKDLTHSADNQREVQASSKSTKKTKSTKTSTKNKSNESNLKHERDSVVEIDPLHAQTNCVTDKSSQVPLHTTEGNSKGRPVEDENSEQILPPEEKVPKASRSDSGTGKSSQVPLHTTESNYKERPVKDKGAERMLHPEKKLPKASRSGKTAPQSSMSDTFTSIPKEVTRPGTLNASETRINSERKSEALAVSKSNLGNSKNLVHQNKLFNENKSGAGQGVRKAFVNETGEVVNSSQHDKSLLTKLGAIFKDDSSGSSEDEDGVDNSNASTRTPSDNSFSSDFSDGESNAKLNSPRNGSNDSKRNNSGGRSIMNSCSSVAKDMDLGTIFRSSRSFKKAKLTASQLQLEDTESQPVDFVPDSLADP
ncbi:uncharacterized protein LOC142630029 [Castanea sativa]|uniref:uncharacterized protein LOC142630029 n=1 Tax=Castanea sativa TaxID=21020 RepID=UPI003F64E279